jgi:NADH-quinone oxidoreductase subunit F
VDLKYMDIAATAAERAAVDELLGEPETGWDGADRSGPDGHVAFGGYHASAARRHLLLPALHAVQGEIGWISKGAMDYVCRRLLVPPADAFGVASFYALLYTEERPPRVAHVCDDICCRSRGAAEIIDQLEAEIGAAGATSDGMSWMSSPCLGQCDAAPAVYFQLAGEADAVLTDATPAEVLAVLRDEPGWRARSGAGGEVVRHRGSLLRRVGVVDPASLEGHLDNGGFEALRRAIDMGADAVLAELHNSNLRGRGGAAFPIGVKWEAVAGAAETERYVICNADESEPGTFKDRVLMEGDPFLVIESLIIAGVTVGAEKGFIYIRAEYPDATAALQAAIAACRDAGYLGDDVAGSGKRFDIEIRRGAGAYICGEETALMESIEGKRGEPRNKPPFPTQHGLFGKPTVINNVETLANVAQIVLEGGEAFAATGTPSSTGTKLFCVSGAVATPGLYEVEMGTTLRQVIELAGGAEGALHAVLLGGAAGSFVGVDALDLPLTFEDSRAHGVSLGSGVIMVFDETADFADLVQRIAAFFRDESCGQCVPCRVGTVRQEELLAGHIASGRPLDTRLLHEIDQVMRDASICGLGHTAAIAIRSAIDIGLVAAT